jgi:hypothetical protein
LEIVKEVFPAEPQQRVGGPLCPRHVPHKHKPQQCVVRRAAVWDLDANEEPAQCAVVAHSAQQHQAALEWRAPRLWVRPVAWVRWSHHAALNRLQWVVVTARTQERDEARVSASTAGRGLRWYFGSGLWAVMEGSLCAVLK